jgi:L-fuconolactonase
VVDAHFHLWRRALIQPAGILEAPYLRRDFLWPDYAAAVAGSGVDRSVFVQVDDRGDGTPEVEFVSEIVAANPGLVGMVAFARLESDQVGRDLERLHRYPLVKGIRRNTQHEADPLFCARPEFIAGARMLGELGLVCELCVKHHQLEGAIRLARACPETSVVLDHLGKPDLTAGSQTDWKDGIARLGELSNTACKISVVVHTEADPPLTRELAAPFVNHAIASFGWERVLFASNWPVSTAVIGYSDWVGMVRDLVSAAGEKERKMLFESNAARLFGLEKAQAL